MGHSVTTEYIGPRSLNLQMELVSFSIVGMMHDRLVYLGRRHKL